MRAVTEILGRGGGKRSDLEVRGVGLRALVHAVPGLGGLVGDRGGHINFGLFAAGAGHGGGAGGIAGPDVGGVFVIPLVGFGRCLGVDVNVSGHVLPRFGIPRDDIVILVVRFFGRESRFRGGGAVFDGLRFADLVIVEVEEPDGVGVRDGVRVIVNGGVGHVRGHGGQFGGRVGRFAVVPAEERVGILRCRLDGRGGRLRGVAVVIVGFRVEHGLAVFGVEGDGVVRLVFVLQVAFAVGVVGNDGKQVLDSDSDVGNAVCIVASVVPALIVMRAGDLGGYDRLDCKGGRRVDAGGISHGLGGLKGGLVGGVVRVNAGGLSPNDDVFRHLGDIKIGAGGILNVGNFKLLEDSVELIVFRAVPIRPMVERVVIVIVLLRRSLVTPIGIVAVLPFLGGRHVDVGVGIFVVAVEIQNGRFIRVVEADFILLHGLIVVELIDLFRLVDGDGAAGGNVGLPAKVVRVIGVIPLRVIGAQISAVRRHGDGHGFTVILGVGLNDGGAVLQNEGHGALLVIKLQAAVREHVNSVGNIIGAGFHVTRNVRICIRLRVCFHHHGEGRFDAVDGGLGILPNLIGVIDDRLYRSGFIKFVVNRLVVDGVVVRFGHRPAIFFFVAPIVIPHFHIEVRIGFNVIIGGRIARTDICHRVPPIMTFVLVSQIILRTVVGIVTLRGEVVGLAVIAGPEIPSVCHGNRIRAAVGRNGTAPRFIAEIIYLLVLFVQEIDLMSRTAVIVAHSFEHDRRERFMPRNAVVNHDDVFRCCELYALSANFKISITVFITPPRSRPDGRIHDVPAGSGIALMIRLRIKGVGSRAEGIAAGGVIVFVRVDEHRHSVADGIRGGIDLRLRDLTVGKDRFGGGEGGGIGGKDAVVRGLDQAVEFALIVHRDGDGKRVLSGSNFRTGTVIEFPTVQSRAVIGMPGRSRVALRRADGEVLSRSRVKNDFTGFFRGTGEKNILIEVVQVGGGPLNVASPHDELFVIVFKVFVLARLVADDLIGTVRVVREVVVRRGAGHELRALGAGALMAVVRNELRDGREVLTGRFAPRGGGQHHAEIGDVAAVVLAVGSGHMAHVARGLKRFTHVEVNV